MGNFGFPISAMDLSQLVSPIFREEWRCALMEHLEQSVMWAGTNWMLKLLAVNLATIWRVSVHRLACLVTTLETVIMRQFHLISLQSHKHWTVQTSVPGMALSTWRMWCVTVPRVLGFSVTHLVREWSLTKSATTQTELLEYGASQVSVEPSNLFLMFIDFHQLVRWKMSAFQSWKCHYYIAMCILGM